MVFYHARDKFYFSETVNPPRTLYSYTGMSRTINIMTMEGQDSLTRKKNDYGCEINMWKKCINMEWSAQTNTVFHWVKTTLPNVTLGH